MTAPSAIVSMQFFNCEAATSQTQQAIATSNTTFYDANGVKTGTAITKQAMSKFTTEYFDTNNTLIGTSIGKWAGSIINTTYYVDNQLVGASKTFWSGTLHITNYFDLEHNIINRSRSKKVMAKSETNYNVPITQEEPVKLSQYTSAPASFSISPLLEEARAREERKNSQFSSSSPTMHRAQPDNPQNEPAIKRRRGCVIL
jgi:hypothetical protein